MPAPTVIIKKYENRRLYDTANSRYVNLEDIAQMVREGVDVQVIDASSGEDLTRLVLTQIIAENAKGSDSAFPLDMLRQMVMASGRVGQEGMLGYMKAMSDIYQSTYRAFSPKSPFDFMQPQPPKEYPAPASTPPPPASPPPSETVDELRRRVEDLERIVTQKNKRSSRQKS